MMKHLRSNMILFFGTLAICCVAYPVGLWAFAHGLFPTKASGSLVAKADGTLVGSTQIAQAFGKDEYFWPRPSAAGYNSAVASGSNWGANNPKLRDRVAQQIGPLVTYRNGKPVSPDIEAWFTAAPDRAAQWASSFAVGAGNWAKADLANDKYGANGEYILAWTKDYPDVIADWKKANASKTDEPKPEDLVTQFFDSYVKTHPGTFPTVVEGKAADGTVEKKIVPAKDGATIQALFFDAWVQDAVNKNKIADIEPVPADFVMASGAGLDPHISVRNAKWQLPRVAAKRGVDAAKIFAVVDELSSSPLGGLAGGAIVNVLELNLALDQRFPLPASP